MIFIAKPAADPPPELPRIAPFAKPRHGPNRLEENIKLAKHASDVFGADLPKLPAKYYRKFAETIDADPEITPPPRFKSFVEYLTPKVREGTTTRGKILARKNREQAFRRLIRNRFKQIQAASRKDEEGAN